MLKIFFLVLLTSIVFIDMSAQKIRYRDIKDYYSIDYYNRAEVYQYYSPLLAGCLSYLLPGAGQIYVGETGRGLAFLGGVVVTGMFTSYGMALSFMDYDYQESISSEDAMFITGMICLTGIYVWSIFDAVHVAKIKNIAFTDRVISMNFRPEINFSNNLAGSNSLVYGASFCLKF